MEDYGRNFGWRVPPESQARQARFSVPATGSRLPIGIPVVADLVAGKDTLGRQIVKVAPADTARGAGAMKGILVFEEIQYIGDDPLLTTYSDKDTVPLGQAAQVVAGDPSAKVWLANTVARTFLGVRPYTGRIMVAGLGATPTLAVGDFLLPGVGNDTDGWWKETNSEANAWLQIMSVDTTRAEVEARMLF